jgi:hypothetical protein
MLITEHFKQLPQARSYRCEGGVDIRLVILILHLLYLFSSNLNYSPLMLVRFFFISCEQAAHIAPCGDALRPFQISVLAVKKESKTSEKDAFQILLQ